MIRSFCLFFQKQPNSLVAVTELALSSKFVRMSSQHPYWSLRLHKYSSTPNFTKNELSSFLQGKFMNTDECHWPKIMICGAYLCDGTTLQYSHSLTDFPDNWKTYHSLTLQNMFRLGNVINILLAMRSPQIGGWNCLLGDPTETLWGQNFLTIQTKLCYNRAASNVTVRSQQQLCLHF